MKKTLLIALALIIAITGTVGATAVFSMDRLGRVELSSYIEAEAELIKDPELGFEWVTEVGYYLPINKVLFAAVGELKYNEEFTNKVDIYGKYQFSDSVSGKVGILFTDVLEERSDYKYVNLRVDLF